MRNLARTFASLTLLFLASCSESTGPRSGAPPSYGTLVDARDSQTYRTVQIGSQIWMAQNLNYAVDSSWCYDDSSINCATYGRLYPWTVAMGIPNIFESATWGGSLPQQGICPIHWHVPSDSEWTTLYLEVGNNNGSLQANSGWVGVPNGTNSSGFTAVPGGNRYPDGHYNVLGSFAIFWTASEESAPYAFMNAIYPGPATSEGKNYNLKGVAYSIRCIEDSQ